MKIARVIGFRPDEDVRAAIKDLGDYFQTDNVSEIIRVTFMRGYKDIKEIPQNLVLQWRREGVIAGAAAAKAKIEAAINTVLKEVSRGDNS